MKRLGVYVFMVATLIGIVFANPYPTHAQGIDRIIEKQESSSYTHDKAKGSVVPLFGSLISAINADVATAQTLTTPTGVERKNTYNTLAPKLITLINEAAALYDSSYDSSLTPAKAQLQAILKVQQLFNAQLPNLSNDIRKIDGLNAIINTFRSQLETARVVANEIDQGRSSGDLAPNAEAVTTAQDGVNKAVTNTDGAKCSIWKVSLVDCVDVLFTWIIKNTLLQVAGFLVWLTANMLNFAIQVSILDFSKWAPDTLYPVWVTIRQIVSLFVVFAGLWLGFMYIIGDETKFGKYVGWLVIFALFVNFSYPFSRALVDISNIVSLNVYSAAVGSKSLETNVTTAATTFGADTAGAIIMNRLGLMGLVGSATEVGNKQSGFVNDIKSTPAALVTLAFVLYAAYIFFMATAIIAMRTAVLVFLIVASPLLLVDSVIPKLGDAAVKMRKLFFEQLIVAPVFMIMLALTLKFMDIFQTGAGAPLGKATGSALTGGAGSIQTFFSILMMLIMLHIMIKVTRSIAGQAGEYATGMIGKVGGFGLGVASGGAGLLARGSIGAAAARMRDSDWMKNNQDSRIGRGMHGLTNSLAQSTFDTRNIGMVKTGMAKAGLTGIGGMGMGQGSKNSYDDDFKIKSQKIQTRSSYIKDAGVRERYLDQMTNTVGSRAQSGALKIFGLTGKEGRSDAEIIRDNLAKNKQKLADRYNAFKDEDKKREFLESQPEDIQEFIKNQKKEAAPIFKDIVPENTAPVQNKTDIETNAPVATEKAEGGDVDMSYVEMAEGKPYTKNKVEDDGVDMSYVEMAEGKPYTKATETAEAPAPTYTPKGTVVPNGAITFNFNGVAHQSFTAAVKQAEKAKTATNPSAPAENRQAVAA